METKEKLAGYKKRIEKTMQKEACTVKKTLDSAKDKIDDAKNLAKKAKSKLPTKAELENYALKAEKTARSFADSTKDRAELAADFAKEKAVIIADLAEKAAEQAKEYINDPASALDDAKRTYNKAKDKTKTVISDIKYDIDAIKERDPAASSSLEVALLYSGFHALIMHRAAHALHERGYKLPARAISQASRLITGVEIHPGAKIGRGFVIDHGSGVVIGETAEIGDNCTVYQGATLGGTGKDSGKRHPTLGNNVMVGAGAKVLGPFTVGDNSKIAANAVVLKEVPPNTTAVGIPAKIVDKKRQGAADLDQIHIPDPVALQIQKLEERIEALENK